MGEHTKVTIVVAARRTGMTKYAVQQCIEWGMVSSELGEADLAQLRRIRRLIELGVNPAGIDIILRMRRRIERLESDLRRMESRRTSVSRLPADQPREQKRGS